MTFPYFFSLPVRLWTHPGEAEGKGTAVGDWNTVIRETLGKFHLKEAGKIPLFNSASFYQAPDWAKSYKEYEDERRKPCSQLFYNLKDRKAKT